VLGALIQNHVIDSDVQSVFGLRGFDFVGRAEQHFGTLDVFVHTFQGWRCGLISGFHLVFVDDFVADDFFADFVLGHGFGLKIFDI
jgi:hypothetical protein